MPLPRTCFPLWRGHGTLPGRTPIKTALIISKHASLDLNCQKRFGGWLRGLFLEDSFWMPACFAPACFNPNSSAYTLRRGCCIKALCFIADDQNREKHTQADGRGREHAATQAESGHSYMIFTLSDRQAQMPLRVSSGSGWMTEWCRGPVG